jgi:hypothetical protein
MERGRYPLVSIPPLQAHCSSTTSNRLNFRLARRTSATAHNASHGRHKAALTPLVIRHWRVATEGPEIAETDLIQRLESPGKARMKLLARKPSFA